MTQALQQNENPNAHAMVYALGKIGPAAKAAILALMKLLKDGDSGVRNAAAEDLRVGKTSGAVGTFAHIGPEVELYFEEAAHPFQEQSVFF